MMERTHAKLPALTTLALSPALTSPSLTTIGSYQTALSYSCSITTFGTYNTAFPQLYCGTPSTTHSSDASGFELDEDNIIIAIVGSTGAGKSTFLKIATGSEDVQVGHTSSPCTQRIRAIRCHNPQRNRDVVLLDTPGFGDGSKSDTEVLAEISDWLKKSYHTGVKLSGILYLHRITDNRRTNTLLRNLDIFQNLCGNDVCSNVRFVTTHWDRLKDDQQGIKTEEELRKKYWNAFLCGGSQMHRFDYTCRSAWQIINSLPMEHIALRIEMVDEDKSLQKTSAVQSLFSSVHNATTSFKNTIEKPIQKIAGLGGKGRRRDSDKKKHEEGLKVARELLKKIKNDDSAYKKRNSGPHSSRSSADSSPWRSLVHKVSDRPKWGRRRGVRHTQTLPKSPDTDSLDAAGDPQGLDSASGSLSCTIQRLQALRTGASQGDLPGFEDVSEITLRISESLNETSHAHHALSSLMDNTSMFLSAINDKYPSTQDYPDFVVKSLEGIHQQLVNVQDIVSRLTNCKPELNKSLTLSLDEQRTITGCSEAVISALRESKIEDLIPGKSTTTASPTTRECSVIPDTGTNHRGSEDLHGFPSSAEKLPKIIAVMGSTGAGKSTFIKAATRTDDGKLPPLMDNVVLVETPGLDDAFEGDVQILKETAKWLQDTYPSGVRLSGILFLHNIMDQRVTNTMLLNFDLFQDLCNSAVLPSVILVTTNWDQLNAENIYDGDVHEQQLRYKYWRPLLNNGSKMLRFENTCFSAWDIINSFPNNEEVRGDGKKKSI